MLEQDSGDVCLSRVQWGLAEEGEGDQSWRKGVRQTDKGEPKRDERRGESRCRWKKKRENKRKEENGGPNLKQGRARGVFAEWGGGENVHGLSSTDSRWGGEEDEGNTER